MDLHESTPAPSIVTQKPCICHNIHLINCNPETCSEAAKPPTALRAIPSPQLLHEYVKFSDLNNAAAAGCIFCTGLRDGILLLGIKEVWWNRKKSDDVGVMICDHRLIVRLDIRTGDGNTGWFHFSFFKKPGPIAEASLCSAFPVSETLSAHTASETSWMNLRNWLKACEKHEACMRKGLLTPPKRVIDVGDADEKVFLLSSSCFGLIIDLYRSVMSVFCAIQTLKAENTRP